MPYAANDQPAALDADALLQASRRVDWRFLLPDPNLGQVAYLGPRRGALLDSLRLFSAALAVGEAASIGGAQYDVVVAHAPSLDGLRRAAGLVRPGGFLYVEVYGLTHRRRLGRGYSHWPRFGADYLAAIERLGLAEATAHWHWPNFESCAEIVPLADRDALLLAMRRRRSGAGARLKSILGRVLLRSGLFVRLAPCFSVVARKPVAIE
ncbi:MAG TPA: hypothetical protein VFO07_04240 [Roseiflexaceae bacterium]|nr:hypothetical protein [Roseiflexaceae bacterium]